MNIKYNGELCSCCGKAPAKVKGLCRRCYERQYYHEKPFYEKQGEIRSEQTLKIISEFATNSSVTASELAEKYGISRQRVSQILKRANICRGDKKE